MAKRKKRSPLPVFFSLAAVIVILGAAVYLFERASTNSRAMDKALYYGITSDDQAAIVVNDTILENKALVQDGRIYIDYPTVWNSFNSSFYWEPQAAEMLLTLPEGTFIWRPDDETGALIMHDGIPYLSAELIRDFSDIDLEIYGKLKFSRKWKPNIFPSPIAISE